MSKKIYTREEFENKRRVWASNMSEDKKLKTKALSLLNEADKYHWLHQANWFGEPSLQSPEDLLFFQDIIFKTKPKFIIESGVAWAGSLLFYASITHMLNLDTKIIGIDIYIPSDLRERIDKFDISKNIILINASSIEDSTIKKIESIIKNNKEVMVHLDSNHSHKHVLKELELYQKFVGKGSYLICGDTIVEHVPKAKHRPRPWGIGDSPQTALDTFMQSNKKFIIDKYYENKSLLSCQANGYLKCING